MKVLGIDFTSAPSRRKPITVATGELAGDVLRIQSVRGISSFEEFESEIGAPGPWIAGIDFPFGQPAKLIRALGWQACWPAYVDIVWAMGKSGYESAIRNFSASQPYGKKELKRVTDIQARSISPMKLGFPAVGKMFFQGAPRILRSKASIVPCAQNEESRVVVEAYPALVAEALAKTRSYKGKINSSKASAQRRARVNIVDRLAKTPCASVYGLVVCLEQTGREQLIEEPEADLLDAVLCSVQAAWASSQPNYGIPDACNPIEGWIVDPSQLTEAESQPLVGVREKLPTQRYSTDLLDRITTNPAICHGKPCIRGMRYPVAAILELLSSGMTTDEILADYDDLEPEDILAALAYAARLSRIKRVQTLTS